MKLNLLVYSLAACATLLPPLASAAPAAHPGRDPNRMDHMAIGSKMHSERMDHMNAAPPFGACR